MPTPRVLAALSALLLVPLGSQPLLAQNLLKYSFSFTARASVFGAPVTDNVFTWSATRPVDQVHCQTPNSITTCWQAVANSKLTIGGVGNYDVSTLFRIRSLSYANQQVGSVGVSWEGSTMFEIWNAQLLGHNLGGPLSPLAFEGGCPGNGGVVTVDCVWQLPNVNLSLMPLTTNGPNGGVVRLTDILSASYSAAVVTGGTDPNTGAGLPAIDEDPDGVIPPGLDCNITPGNCVPASEVPEPASGLLLTAGLLGLGLARWTRRRRSDLRR